LVAAHLGVQHVKGGNAPALVAAVNLMLADTTTAAAFAAGMLTQNGRCKTLDATADGYVRSVAGATYQYPSRTIMIDRWL
jgi:acyl transferase domain-containing protein